MEFLSEHEHNVIVRTATVVPRSCTALDISALVPISHDMGTSDL